MAKGEASAQAPAWTVGATARQAFLRGLSGVLSVPVLVVSITFIGFGALARDAGLDLFQAVFVAATVFALPGQVVLADSIAHGAGLGAVAFAVALTSVRLLPMCFALMPVMRGETTPRWLEYLLSHFVAITVWLEAMLRLPRLPRHLRVAYFGGFAAIMLMTLTSATALGFELAAQVPPTVAAGMVFMTPIYFFLSLVETAKNIADNGAVIGGAILGPLLYGVLPGLDLVLTGLIAGTLSYAAMKWRRGRVSS